MVVSDTYIVQVHMTQPQYVDLLLYQHGCRGLYVFTSLMPGINIQSRVL